LTGERRSNVRKPCPSATLTTTIWLRSERRPINRLNNGIAPVKAKIRTESYLKTGSPELHLKIHFSLCSKKKKTLFWLKNLIRHCRKETNCFYIVNSVHCEILKLVSSRNAQLYTLLRQNKCIFIVQYVLLYVVTKSWCQLPEEGDKAETCMEHVKNAQTVELCICWCHRSLNISSSPFLTRVPENTWMHTVGTA